MSNVPSFLQGNKGSAASTTNVEGPPFPDQAQKSGSSADDINPNGSTPGAPVPEVKPPPGRFGLNDNTRKPYRITGG